MHDLLVERGLERYYQLAKGDVLPVDEVPAARSHLWLEAALAEAGDDQLHRLTLDVQGLHCAACVWLLNETFRGRAKNASITVNPALGTVRLIFERGFDVGAWVTEVEAFGYRFGPARKSGSRDAQELSLRLGVTAALTLNVMLFSISFYVGLAPRDGELFVLFTWLSVAFSTAAVLIGGWPFFRAAIQGLRQGLLHLELPIAVGIVLVYGASLAQLADGHDDITYLDTLNTFITLMLLGRWLQRRVVERNRRFLLDDDGADGILVRVVWGARVVATPAPKVRAGDTLLVAPSELVPVDATLVDARAELNCEWMTGESRTKEVLAGGRVAAGSFNGGRQAFHAIAAQDFSASTLVSLLREPTPRHGASGAAWWSRFSKRWVVKVLAVATVGFVVWLPTGLERATGVAASLLVVTCPCAIGLAIPLAYELVQARLRRQGFFIRSSDLLDRLLDVRHVVFDKTGTLTVGRLDLSDPAALDELSAAERDTLFNLATRSSHPVAGCIAAALTERHANHDAAATVVEHPGLGVEWRDPSAHLWRLGRPSWAAPNANVTGGLTVLSRDGTVRLTLAVRERVRRDAAAELAALNRRGVDVWLMSGDEPSRVATFVTALGLDPAKAFGGLTPAQKADKVDQLGAGHTLYLGDGVNDALAFERALAAGTPVVDRPVVPTRSDFFLVDGSVGSLHQALDAAHGLHQVVRQLITVSLSYNLLAISACLAGLVTPLVAAIAMPASTLSLLALTITKLNRRVRPPLPAVGQPLALEARG